MKVLFIYYSSLIMARWKNNNCWLILEMIYLLPDWWTSSVLPRNGMLGAGREDCLTDQPWTSLGQEEPPALFSLMQIELTCDCRSLHSPSCQTLVLSFHPLPSPWYLLPLKYSLATSVWGRAGVYGWGVYQASWVLRTQFPTETLMVFKTTWNNTLYHILVFLWVKCFLKADLGN